MSHADPDCLPALGHASMSSSWILINTKPPNLCDQAAAFVDVALTVGLKSSPSLPSLIFLARQRVAEDIQKALEPFMFLSVASEA